MRLCWVTPQRFEKKPATNEITVLAKLLCPEFNSFIKASYYVISAASMVVDSVKSVTNLGLAQPDFLHRIGIFDLEIVIFRLVTNCGSEPPTFNFGLVIQLVLRLWAQHVWYDMISFVWL